jgi:hypothetical protein
MGSDENEEKIVTKRAGPGPVIVTLVLGVLNARLLLSYSSVSRCA